MELFNTFKDALNPAKFIDQAEKNTQAVLSYIQPKELSKTLIDLTSDTTEFVRAQLAAVESIATITKEHTEEFVKSFSKSAK
jgi:HEAT repeat protein